MSASARNYAYVVKVKDEKKPEPVLSKENLDKAKQNIAKYLGKDYEFIKR